MKDATSDAAIVNGHTAKWSMPMPVAEVCVTSPSAYGNGEPRTSIVTFVANPGRSKGRESAAFPFL